MRRVKTGSFMSRLIEQLDKIETEMKFIGYWFDADLEGTDKAFEHWLQFKFLPQARRRIADNDLPKDSQVGLAAMRQYDYHSYVPEAQNLFALLSEFDELVREHAGTQRTYR